MFEHLRRYDESLVADKQWYNNSLLYGFVSGMVGQLITTPLFKLNIANHHYDIS
jgi:hypothetical protein